MVISLGGNADRGGGDEEEVEQVPKPPGKKTTRRPFFYLKISLEPYIGAYSKSLVLNIVVKNQTPQETYF